MLVDKGVTWQKKSMILILIFFFPLVFPKFLSRDTWYVSIEYSLVSRKKKEKKVGILDNGMLISVSVLFFEMPCGFFHFVSMHAHTLKNRQFFILYNVCTYLGKPPLVE